MADYNEAYIHLMLKEGGWTEKPNETAFGIDRKANPGWIGWYTVDAVKKIRPPDLTVKEIRKWMTERLQADQTFMTKVFVFFRQNYWSANYNRLKDQKTANYIFDKAVVMGPMQAHRLVQRGLKISDDGLFGSRSVEASNALSFEEFNAKVDPVVDAFFTKLGQDHPENAQYVAGWDAR